MSFCGLGVAFWFLLPAHCLSVSKWFSFNCNWCDDSFRSGNVEIRGLVKKIFETWIKNSLPLTCMKNSSSVFLEPRCLTNDMNSLSCSGNVEITDLVTNLFKLSFAVPRMQNTSSVFLEQICPTNDMIILSCVNIFLVKTVGFGELNRTELHNNAMQF